jgi:hypothetical protein
MVSRTAGTELERAQACRDVLAPARAESERDVPDAPARRDEPGARAERVIAVTLVVRQHSGGELLTAPMEHPGEIGGGITDGEPWAAVL